MKHAPTTQIDPEMTRGLNLSHRTGVYSIINTLNQKLYIGSAARSFMSRWSLHRVRLRDNRHHSKHLQSAWNKYGHEAFEFGVVEDCSPEKCIKREQFWLDFFRPEYNSRLVAKSPLGKKMSTETRMKMSAARKGIKLSEETKRRMSVSHRIRPPISEETRARMRIANSGRIYSLEQLERMRCRANRNRKSGSRGPMSPEHRLKISIGNKGKKISKESLEKRTKTRSEPENAKRISENIIAGWARRRKKST